MEHVGVWLVTGHGAMNYPLMTNKQLQLRCAACTSPLDDPLCAVGMAKAVSIAVTGIHQQRVCCH
jgi:hypothetical protein